MSTLAAPPAAVTDVRGEATFDTFELQEVGPSEPVRQVESQVSAPLIFEAPNGGYAWVCAWSVFLINAHTWGVNAVGTLHSALAANTKEALTVCLTVVGSHSGLVFGQ
jgi:hypothetical protein